MTVQEVIARADALRPNAVPEAQKIRWISALEAMIKDEIADTHAGWDAEVPEGSLLAPDDELFAPLPYDGAYVFWLLAHIDAANGEFDSYANSVRLFHNAFSAFADHVNRTHPPKSAEVNFG